MVLLSYKEQFARMRRSYAEVQAVALLLCLVPLLSQAQPPRKNHGPGMVVQVTSSVGSLPGSVTVVSAAGKSGTRSMAAGASPATVAAAIQLAAVTAGIETELQNLLGAVIVYGAGTRVVVNGATATCILQATNAPSPHCTL